MPVMLAKNWNGSDPTGWWISEKLDGVRALWDGATLTTRTGQTITAPESWLASLPVGVSLDGELWLGRGSFQRVVSAYRSTSATAWAGVRFAVFDSPASSGGFEDRQSVLRDTLTGRKGPAFQLEHRRCLGRQDLAKTLASTIAGGGEGLMIREPGSSYEPRRSGSLLKVKTAHDAEATVVGYQTGTGRNRSTIGALVATLPDGTVFAVGGLSDAVRQSPPAVGSTITFRHHDYTDGGVPRFPSFVR